MSWIRRTDSRQGRHSRKEGGLIRSLLLLALLAWAVRSLLVAPFSIPSGSMLPSLFIGDYLLVAKWPYGYSRFSFPFHFPPFEGRILSSLPERGDVVVFRPEGSDVDYVKRVIGLPGDRVAVEGGRIRLNGRPVPREAIGRFAMPISANSPCKVVPPASQFVELRGGQPHCLYPAFLERLPGGANYSVLDQVDTAQGDDFAEVTVPEGHLFLMGDNRDDSLDSRFLPAEGGIGFVPVEKLAGRAMVTFWSTDGTAVYWKPWTWFGALRASRIGNDYDGPHE